MPNKEADKLDNMMQKVEGLLAKADHPNTPPEEADTARMMAERIMVKYKIEQEDLIKRGELKSDQFAVVFKTVQVCPLMSPYQSTYRAMMSYIIHHAGCMGVWNGYNNDGDEIMVTIEVIGYEADIRYLEVLFMSARIVFADRMEPKADPNLSDMENVYRMRSAGMERIKIAKVMGWEKGGAKVTRMYKKACEERGEDPVLTGRSMNVGHYREAYANGFLNRLWDNLSHARIAVERELDSGGLVLHGRKERIKEAMYDRYPELRPGKEPVKTDNKPSRKIKWTKADQRRAERLYSGAGLAGQSAGKAAADEVQINQNAPKRRINE